MCNWVRGLRRIGWVAAISCVGLMLFSGVGHAQSFNVTNLTNNTSGKASFPNMVVDGNGNTYLAWVDAVNHGIAVASQFDGAKFNTKVLIPTPVLPAFQPQIAVRVVSGPLPNVEIVWASLDPATPSAQVYDVFAARSDDG